MRKSLAALAILAVAPGWIAARQEKSVTVGFHGGNGAAKVVEEKGQLDCQIATPERVLTLAPYDKVDVQLVGLSTFKGKTLKMSATWIETKTRTETFGFLGLFTKKIHEHIPHPKDFEPATKLVVGGNVLIKIVAKYPSGAERVVLILDKAHPADYFRADQKVDLRAQIEVDPGSVAWQDRDIQDGETAEFRRWVNDLKSRHKEVKDEKATVTKGNLDQLRVVVTGRR
jgi:hypothetical protein